MKTKNINEIWNGDEFVSLKEAKEKIDLLIEKYGKDALIGFDAGDNNIRTELQYKKKSS